MKTKLELPTGTGWYYCKCPADKFFCEHYLGMTGPYALCDDCSKQPGYIKTEKGFGRAEDRKCESCIVASGLYY